MHQNLFIIVLLSIFYTSHAQNNNAITPPERIVTDTYFGQKIKDPYRYMENVADTNVIAWYRQQEAITYQTLQKISNRQALLDQQEVFDKRKSHSIKRLHITESDVHFYLKRRRNEDAYQLYYRQGYKGEETFLYDPKAYKPQSGHKYSINYISPSWDGSKIVISLTKNGEEISEMVIMDIKTKTLLPEVIDHCWPAELGGVRWLPDNSGFLYLHIPEVDTKSDQYILNTATVLYKLGDDPKKLYPIFSKEANREIPFVPADFAIVELEDPKDTHIIGVLASVSLFSDYYYAPIQTLQQDSISWKPLCKKEDLISEIHKRGDALFFLTAKDAPNYKICKTTLSNPNIESATVVVSEDPDYVITDWTITKSGLFYVKTKNGVQAKFYQWIDGVAKEIPLPIAAGEIILQRKSIDSDALWLYMGGWTSRGDRYRYHMDSGTFTAENMSPSIQFPELKDTVIEEIEIPGHDGVMIPLSLIYKKELQKDSTNPVFMIGYGSYGINYTPYPTIELVQWVDRGGIYAVAHVRGGGEKGEAWHKGGFKTTKPNTWKDFNSCAEYVIANNYTNPDKIVGRGRSAGGILSGRAVTSRPDLYQAMIMQVGVLNALRKEFAPNGPNNIKEFGTVTIEEEYQALLEMDAYHHIEEGEKYPALLITTGMNDARVVPWQCGKFVAKMQKANGSDNPILFGVDFKGGHGMDRSVAKRFKENADVLSFALWQTGHPDYQPKKEE